MEDSDSDEVKDKIGLFPFRNQIDCDFEDKDDDGQPFEVVYYPRASTSELWVKASNVKVATRIQWCPRMRFKMAFETEDSSRISCFMGTISLVQVDDQIRWPNSPRRLLLVQIHRRFLDLIIGMIQRLLGIIRTLILNNRKKLNALDYDMIRKMFEKPKAYENDPTVNLDLLKIRKMFEKPKAYKNDLTLILFFLMYGK
ncbi:hypothetical protein L2E82_03544 [Cichorium intybus]|uniref:Uncharacterized protein n=1 Tax=Cichorium intybus TaxID=13427 RepID=A0ACB9H4N3_CICIN|nr:hypothetical protein L2E82_03544 [Cichorium intybus]